VNSELGIPNGARTGLTGFVGGLARQVARHNVTINGLLPGPFLTDRLRSGRMEAAKKAAVSVDDFLRQAFQNTVSGRPGDPAEFGAACAFLCSASSGFIVGQNLLPDGGIINSTMG
jgi:3-oxoacyl-[acyl-carrier protein] reductase